MIRPAGKDDIGIIAKMIGEDCEEMNLPVNPEYTTRLVEGLVANECLLFVKEKGSVIGACALLAAPSIFDSRKMFLSNILWYASKELNQIARARVMVELLDFMVWLANDRKMELHVSLPASKKQLSGGELLESRGLVMAEQYYKKVA